jgi:hypothetical protein
MKLEDQIRRLIALKQEVPPPPTLLEKSGSVKDGLIGGHPGPCGTTYPVKYDFLGAAGVGSVWEIYKWMMPFLYCREFPNGACEPLYLDESEGPSHIVTTRDKPLTWQRQHPEFNPDDPATWGSLFGPGGLVERMVRSYHPGVSDEDINAMVDIIRQFYAVKCGFLVSQGGSCCTFDDFGGAMCREAISADTCEGVFTLGGSCGGANPCSGFAPNLIEINDQIK